MTHIEYEPIGGAAVILSQVDAVTAHLANLEPLMIEAQAIVYEHTEAWFNSKGDGTWPPLARDTKFSKSSRGTPFPARPLYAWGNLYKSVISGSGPYSWTTPLVDGIGFGVHWTNRGYAIADVLATGTSSRSGHGGIPARPIWPPPASRIGLLLLEELGSLFLRGVGGAVSGVPAWRGARMGRGAGGRFTSLKKMN